MIIPQDIIYFYHMYINLSTGNTLLQIFVKLVFMYIYICIVKIILWMCHHRTFVNLKLQENSSPIVLIEIPTIVLKEGKSERGYNPETPSNFWNNPKDSDIE